MPDAPDPAALTALLGRARGGDPAAVNDLIRTAQGRLETLARRMLRNHAAVRRWADTDDVFQNAVVRLLRALGGTPVADTRAFFNLAASVIRRELIDLARHYRGPEGVGANHASTPDDRRPPDPAAPAADAELDQWAALHAAVEALPAEEREVFGLTFYHRWGQAEIAELFGVDVRTVGRRWRRAVEALHAALGGTLPDS